MKILKLLSLGFVTLLVLSLLTACGPASVLEEPIGGAEEDAIDVNIDGGGASASARGSSNLAFNPNISNGVLVPTGAGITTIALVSGVLGVVASKKRKQ